MNAEELQRIINREARQREALYGVGTAGALKKDLATVAEAYNRKHPQAQHVPTSAEPGPQTRQAMKVAAAITRARAGQVAGANVGPRWAGVHKLPTYVVNGRS